MPRPVAHGWSRLQPLPGPAYRRRVEQLDRRAFAGLALAALTAPPAQAAGRSDIAVPLHLERNLLTVAVTLNGQGPYPFLLASGHLFGQVDPALAEQVGLERRANPAVEGRSVMGQVLFQLYKVDEMVLGGAWRIQRTELIAGEFGPGAEIRGVFPFTSFLPSTLDFTEPQLRIHRAFARPSDGVKQALIQRSGPMHAAPAVRANFGGKTLKLNLDTGNACALTLYPDAVRRLGLWDRYPRRLSETYSDQHNRNADLRVVRGDPLEIAGQTFPAPVVRMMTPDRALEDQVDEDGVIGMDILKRFRMTFDPKRQSVWFWPNARMGEAFRYDRAGAAAEGGVVSSVDADGPAARAGLRVGDRVLLINGQPAADVDWRFSGPAGEVLALTVERDGQHAGVPLVLEERL